MGRHDGDQSMAEESLPETISYELGSGNNPSANTQGMEYEESASAEPQGVTNTRLSSVTGTRSRRQRHSDEGSLELGTVETHQSRQNDGDGGDTHLHKKRRLSNIVDPIDICEPMDEDSD